MKIWMAALAALGLAGMGEAQTADTYGLADATWDAQVSPDGHYVALGCSPRGHPAVCLFDLQGSESPKLFDPGGETRLSSFYWASNDHIVAEVALSDTLHTSSGLKHYEFYRALSHNISDGSTAVLMRDEKGWLDLTSVVGLCDDDPEHIVMQIGYRASWDGPVTGSRVTGNNLGVRTELYTVDLNSGRSRRRPDRNKSIYQTVLDAECEPFVDVIYNDERREYAIELVDENRTLIEFDNVETWPMTVIGPSNDREHLIVRADHQDLVGLYTLALADGTLEPLTYQGVELGKLGVLRDRFSDTVFGFSGTADITQHYYIEKDLVDLQAMLEAALPGHLARILSFDRDHTLYTLIAEMPGAPPSFYLYDAALKEVSPLGALAPQLAEAPLASVTPISYPARDGLEIPGYLVLPPGMSIEDGPFPTILMPHGGPESRDTASYDWWSHAYAAEGYAVIKPNFRGSSGYGPEFRDAGFGEFGGAMVDDVVDAIAWAEAEGISDPRGVCVAGASYGGYSALMTGLKAPDKVGCIVSVAPVTDIFSHMSRYDRDTDGYRYWARYAGGDVFAAEEERTAISPSDRAGEYRVPVLLIHGKEDLVVRIDQSERFRYAWGSRPGLRFVELDGQDHYLRTSQARQTVLAESLALLAEHHPAR